MKLRIALLLLLAAPAQAWDLAWVVHEQVATPLAPSHLSNDLVVDSLGRPLRSLQVNTHGNTVYGDIRLDQYDTDGTLLWSLLLEGPAIRIKDMVFADGGVVVAGSYASSMHIGQDHQLTAPGSTRQGFLLRLDGNHAVDWLIDPGMGEVWAAAADPRGGFWVGVPMTFTDSVLHRFNSTGNVIETRAQSGAQFVTGLAVADDGTVWVAGSTFSGDVAFGDLTATAPFEYNIFVVKYGPDGSAQWVRFVQDVTVQNTRVVLDHTGGAYLAGNSPGVSMFGDFPTAGSDWVYNFFLTRISATGTFLWLQELPDDGVLGDATVGKGTFVSCPDSASVFCGGFYRRDVMWGGAAAPPIYGGYDVLALQYAADGTFVAVETAGGPTNDVADAIAVDTTGRVYLAGSASAGAAFGDEVFGSGPRSFLAAYAAPVPASTDLPSGTDLRLAENRPNPFNPQTSIDYRLATPGAVRLQVFDVRGSLVRTLVDGWHGAGDHEVRWNGLDGTGQAAPSGVYLYRLETNAGRLTRRMVLVR